MKPSSLSCGSTTNEKQTTRSNEEAGLQVKFLNRKWPQDRKRKFCMLWKDLLRCLIISNILGPPIPHNLDDTALSGAVEIEHMTSTLLHSPQRAWRNGNEFQVNDRMKKLNVIYPARKSNSRRLCPALESKSLSVLPRQQAVKRHGHPEVLPKTTHGINFQLAWWRAIFQSYTSVADTCRSIQLNNARNFYLECALGLFQLATVTLLSRLNWQLVCLCILMQYYSPQLQSNISTR